MIKLLIVDDEILEREALKKITQEMDDTSVVGETDDGDSAVKLVEKLQPDIIFMDLTLPGLDGMEAARQIKGKNSEQTIFFLCHFNHGFNRGSLLEYADDYLVKPIRPADLHSLLSKYKIKLNKGIFTDNGLLGKLLENVQMENYSEAKAYLQLCVEEMTKHYKGKRHSNFRETLNILVRGLRKLCESKGIVNLLPESVWISEEDTITRYNVHQRLDALLLKIFEVLLKLRQEHSQIGIQDILNYIEIHYMDGISLDQVASFVHLNPHYLSRLFKEEVGKTFIEYVTERKIEHAKFLLRNTNMQILNVAISLSFQEQTYFSKVFKKNVGLTPTEYRNQHRKEIDVFTRNKKLDKYWYI